MATYMSDWTIKPQIKALIVTWGKLLSIKSVLAVIILKIAIGYICVWFKKIQANQMDSTHTHSEHFGIFHIQNVMQIHIRKQTWPFTIQLTIFEVIVHVVNILVVTYIIYGETIVYQFPCILTYNKRTTLEICYWEFICFISCVFF